MPELSAVPVSTAWYSLRPEEVAARLGVDPLAGLSEAEATRRSAAFGENVIKPAKQESLWRVFLNLMREPLMLLLFTTAVLYSIWGNLRDALTIVLVVVLMVAAEMVNDYRASRTIAGLSHMVEPTARVIRAGREEEVQAAAVVPGDLLAVAAGCQVAADARLLQAFGLAVDESALTGESIPAEKDPGAALGPDVALADRVTMVYAGTMPSRGNGVAIVVETGARTELGGIAAATSEAEQPKTPMQKTIDELSAWLTWPALAISVLVPLLGFLLVHEPLRRMLLTGLALVYAMVPEELPLIITMVLAVGCYRLARRGALTKRMASAETLGSVTVIVTDKTGTLTEGRLVLSDVEPSAAREHLLETGVLTTLTVGGGSQEAVDPFDIALLEAAHRSDEAGEPGPPAKLVDEFPFDNTRRRMSVVRSSEGGFLVAVRGAPESVLGRCDRVLDGAAVHEFGPEARARLSASVDRLAADGLRVLAFAEKQVRDRPAGADDAESGLVLVGVAGFKDPVRAEVPAAIDTCHHAGIRVLMMTGDHPDTATVVAAAIGLPRGRVLTGSDLDGMPDDQLVSALEHDPVMARCTPSDKQRVVRVLEGQGEVVAVTGDGINDAPALALANVGVAMGRRGTDVARQAAGVVLVDDNFATIEKAVEEGRVIRANLRKGIRFYLSFKLALALTTLAPVLFLFPVPFAPIQIILTELFMDLGASATFVAEPAEPGLMEQPPADPRARFMDRPMVLSILGAGLTLTLVVLVAYLIGKHNAGTATAQTMAFVTLLFGTALMAINMRSERTPLYKLGLTSNPVILAWSAAVVAAALIIVLLPAAHSAFKTVALTGSEWALVVLLAVAGAAWVELAKLWSAKAHRGPPVPASGPYSAVTP